MLVPVIAFKGIIGRTELYGAFLKLPSFLFVIQ